MWLQFLIVGLRLTLALDGLCFMRIWLFVHEFVPLLTKIDHWPRTQLQLGQRDSILRCCSIFFSLLIFTFRFFGFLHYLISDVGQGRLTICELCAELLILLALVSSTTRLCILAQRRTCSMLVFGPSLHHTLKAQACQQQRGLVHHLFNPL